MRSRCGPGARRPARSPRWRISPACWSRPASTFRRSTRSCWRPEPRVTVIGSPTPPGCWGRPPGDAHWLTSGLRCWRSRAAVANRAGAPNAARRAIREGETLLDELRMAVGSPELRSRLALYGAELSTADVDRALASGSVARLMRAMERWRAASLRLPRVRRPSDPQLGFALDALRTAEHKAQATIRDGTHDASHERALRQLRRPRGRARARLGRVDGSRGQGPGARRPSRAARRLDRGGARRAPRHAVRPGTDQQGARPSWCVAPCEVVQREAALLRSALGRVLTSVRPDTRIDADELVVEAARRVDDLLLGPLQLPDDTHVVVVPPSSLGARALVVPAAPDGSGHGGRTVAHPLDQVAAVPARWRVPGGPDRWPRPPARRRGGAGDQPACNPLARTRSPARRAPPRHCWGACSTAPPSPTSRAMARSHPRTRCSRRCSPRRGRCTSY